MTKGYWETHEISACSARALLAAKNSCEFSCGKPVAWTIQ